MVDNAFDFKVAVIGCGNIARIQLKYITKLVKKESIALCDSNQIRMEYLSEKFGISNTFTNADSLLTEFKPKIVHILTPPHTHKDIAIACLKKGCHVFIEKPMGLSVKEAEEIIEIANNNGLLVCVDHMRLFAPEIMKVKKLLDSGKLGRIVNIISNEVDNYLDRKNNGLSPKWLTDLPGEIFFDLLPHHLSMVYAFLPELQFERVVYQKNEHDEIVNISCLFSTPHASAHLRMSILTYPLQNQLIIECTNGGILIDFRNALTIIRTKSALPGFVERVLDNMSMGTMFIFGTFANMFRFLRGKLDPYAGMANTIRAFYTAIKNNDESPISNENALSVTKAIECIFEKIPIKQVKHHKRIITNESQLQSTDILVTGGTGFIGKKLVKRLLQEGKRVRVLTHRQLTEREINVFPKENVELYFGDISNSKDVENACRGVKKVYHLAAATKGNWFYHLDTTVNGTKNIIEASVKSGIERLVYVSTIGLLNAAKYPENQVINESFPYEEHPEKRGFYSEAKLKAEEIVLQYMDRAPIIIIRPGIVYGPGKDLLSLVATKLNKKIVWVQGKNKKNLPLVYVENLVDALILAGESEVTGIYNVIDDDKITVKQFITIYKKMTGETFFSIGLTSPFFKPIFWMTDWFLSIVFGNPSSLMYKIHALSRSVVHSSERIKNTLGWKPRISFEDGMIETIHSLKSDS